MLTGQACMSGNMYALFWLWLDEILMLLVNAEQQVLKVNFLKNIEKMANTNYTLLLNKIRLDIFNRRILSHDYLDLIHKVYYNSNHTRIIISRGPANI